MDESLDIGHADEYLAELAQEIKTLAKVRHRRAVTVEERRRLTSDLPRLSRWWVQRVKINGVRLS